MCNSCCWVCSFSLTLSIKTVTSGVGYQVVLRTLCLIRSLFYNFRADGVVVIIYLICIILFKVIATAATNGGGGVGGLFAPSLFVGGLTGYVMAYAMNYFLGFDLPLKNFAFAGMAGVMSGVMYAPLTAIFLIAEVTGGYELFMTLMITSTVAYLTMNVFETHSIYAMRLAKEIPVS